jgi:hypothetical protein
MMPGRRYFTLHTHRVSTSFSDADALVLVENPLLRAVGVIGADGTWYFLSRGRGRPAGEAVVRAFTAAAIALSRTYLVLMRSGALAREEALRAFSHAIWERVAPPLGLRYDRIR